MSFVKRFLLKAVYCLVIFSFGNIVQLQAQEFSTFEVKGKTSLKNEKGEIIVQPKYIGEFKEGLAVVSTRQD